MTTQTPILITREGLQQEALRRLGPLFALLDTRYIPLFLLAIPQSYSVFMWLYAGSDKTYAAWLVAFLGAAAFEFSYVGSVAWAEQGTTKHQRAWIIITAIVALLFSIAVAIRVHWLSEGWWALLHGGFPLVACLYTVTVHTASRAAPIIPLDSVREEFTQLLEALRQQVEGLSATLQAQEGQAAEALSTLREELTTKLTVLAEQPVVALTLPEDLGVLIQKVDLLSASFDTSSASLRQHLNSALNGFREELDSVTTRLNAIPAPIAYTCPYCARDFGSAQALGGHQGKCSQRPILETSNGHG